MQIDNLEEQLYDKCEWLHNDERVVGFRKERSTQPTVSRRVERSLRNPTNKHQH